VKVDACPCDARHQLPVAAVDYLAFESSRAPQPRAGPSQSGLHVNNRGIENAGTVMVKVSTRTRSRLRTSRQFLDCVSTVTAHDRLEADQSLRRSPTSPKRPRSSSGIGATSFRGRASCLLVVVDSRRTPSPRPPGLRRRHTREDREACRVEESSPDRRARALLVEASRRARVTISGLLPGRQDGRSACFFRRRSSGRSRPRA
jgi:hypothetical protein